MRQENKKINADDLHNLLVLSRYGDIFSFYFFNVCIALLNYYLYCFRLLSVSRGMHTLEKNIWDYACRLENQRRDRIR